MNGTEQSEKRTTDAAIQAANSFLRITEFKENVKVATEKLGNLEQHVNVSCRAAEDT